MITGSIPVLDMIGMKLRKTDVKAVLWALVVAKQGGIVIPWRAMEQAGVRGANLDRVTMAIIQAHKQGLDVTFQELVDADLEDRLADKLAHKDVLGR